jgi:5-methylthioadenosine/S-adenosylhomocysteine deaminase
MIEADLQLTGATIWPSADRGVIRDGVIAIRKDRIVAVGAPVAMAPVRATKSIDLSGFLITPGLVDAHTHLALSVARGATWRGGHPVYDVFWPMERRLDPSLVESLARLGAAEALLAGTTTVNDHYFFAEATATAVASVGLRAVVGECVMTGDGPWSGRESVQRTERFLSEWLKNDPLVTPSIAPHAPDTVDDKTLVWCGRRAAELDVLMHLHLAQSDREVDVISTRANRTPVQHLRSLRFGEPRILAAHCTRTDSADLDTLARWSQMTVAFCPTVHALDGRVLAAADLHDLGGRVAVATDAAPNERRSLHSELRVAGAVQGTMTGKGAAAFPPSTVWEAATEVPAAALGLPVGALRAGSFADLVVWRTDRPNTVPFVDPAVMMVGALSDRDIEGVMVGGQWRVLDGELVGVDVDEIVAEARRAVQIAWAD